MQHHDPGPTRGRLLFAAVGALALVAAACTQGSSGNQQASTAKQTIVFATQGLGSEGDATKAPT